MYINTVNYVVHILFTYVVGVEEEKEAEEV